MNKQDIKLKEIPEPLWTDELLLHFIKYGWNEYGFVKINSYKDQAEYINSLKEVMNDSQNDTPKSFPVSGKYYEINNINDTVGFIVLVQVEDPEYGEALELEMGIFDKYSNNKIATIALDMIIKRFSGNQIDAIISENNQNKGRVRKLLKQGGFKKISKEDNKQSELWLLSLQD